MPHPAPIPPRPHCQKKKTVVRSLHSFSQELRGNVRVFARVRPFLPSDGVGPDEVPAVIGKGDGVGCVVSKRLVGDDGKELAPEVQSFSFDKCFPPR